MKIYIFKLNNILFERRHKVRLSVHIDLVLLKYKIRKLMFILEKEGEGK